MRFSRTMLLVSLMFCAFSDPLLGDDLNGTASFSLQDIKIVKVKGFDFVEFTNGVPIDTVGSPALPAFQLDMAVPWNIEVQGVSILKIETRELEGVYDIIPMTSPKPCSDDEETPDKEPFLKDPQIYTQDANFPGYPIEYLSTWDLVGQKFVKLVLYPVQYNPVKGKLTLVTRIDFTIDWFQPSMPSEPMTFNLTEAGRAYYEHTLKKAAWNPEAVSIPPFVGSNSRALAPGQYEHVIITPQSLQNFWSDLVDWHTRKGFPDTVITKEYIYANYSGSTNQQKIRNFVIDAHSTWGTRFFLMGADGGDGTYQVPYHERYLLDEYVPNDTYYADYNGNWVVDVHVGRASVTSSILIDNFIDKILRYETNPSTTDYAEKILFLGFDLDDQTDGEDVKILIDNSHLPNYVNLLTEYDSEGGTHLSDVIAYMNTGPNIFNHIDHCSASGWGMGYTNHGHTMSYTDVNNLTNGWDLINAYSLGCHANAWDNTLSLSESFLRKVGSAGVSFTGNTRYGWYNPGYNITLSNLYEVRWWHVLYDDNDYHVGEALTEHKNDYYPNSDHYRYIFTELNALGDPSMPLWKRNPVALSATYDDPISTGNQSFAVNVKKSGSNLSGALVCLWKDSEVYEFGLTNFYGNRTFTINPTTSGTMLVTVTAQDCLPHEGQVTVGAGGPPGLTGITPVNGSTAGGTACTLSGFNFTTTPDTAVTFGGVGASNVVVVDSSTITCTSPAHSSGLVNITVTNSNGSDTLTGAFTYHNPPQITSINPDHGAISGGTPVSISGSAFTLVGTTQVTFGGVSASNIVVVSPLLITCTTPAHSAGAVHVVVTNDFGSDTLVNGFSYDPAPQLDAINPDSGPMGGGTLVTLSGNYFTSSADTTVRFAGVLATGVNVISATQLTCQTPSHATGTVNVTVYNSNGSDTLVDGFTYYTSPVVGSVNPPFGPIVGGTAVTIQGNNFTNSGDTQVTFDGSAAPQIVVLNSTSLTCNTPAHVSGPVDVMVSNSYGSDTLENGYIYESPPVIYSMDPTEGTVAGSTSVTIYGSNFAASFGNTTVDFEGTTASNIVIIDYGTITCNTPPHTSGPTDVTVGTINGSDTLTNGFFFHNPPFLSAANPDNGPMGGMTPVTLTGSDFTLTGDMVVRINDIPVLDMVVLNSTTITCNTPPSGSSGPKDIPKDIYVSNIWGADTLTGGFSYNPPPEIIDISPSAGLFEGGATITITGNYFLPGFDTQVLFEDIPANQVVVG